MGSPLIQVAIDVKSVAEARPIAEMARKAGADWIEIGKPLIEFEGLNGVRSLVAELAGTYVLLDTMIIAAPEKYIRAAREIGARNVTVTALAPRETVVEAIRFGREMGIEVTVDLFNVPNLLEQARWYAAHGADFVMVHFGVDQKRNQPDGSPIALLREVVDAVDVPVSYATYDLTESLAAVDAGASVIVQGEPLISQVEAESALRHFISMTTSRRSGAQE